MTPGRLQTAAGVIVYVSTLAAIVYLAATGHDAGIEQVMLLAGPVVAALLIDARLRDQHAATSAALGKITEQTNGILDARIAEGVRATLETHAPDIYTGRHET